MSEKPQNKTTREERLAEKLRENLRRRKAQGRAMRDLETEVLSKPDDGG